MMSTGPKLPWMLIIFLHAAANLSSQKTITELVKVKEMVSILMLMCATWWLKNIACLFLKDIRFFAFHASPTTYQMGRRSWLLEV